MWQPSLTNLIFLFIAVISMLRQETLTTISMLAPNLQTMRSIALSARVLSPDARQLMRVRTRFRRRVVRNGIIITRLPNGHRDGYHIDLYKFGECRMRMYFMNDMCHGTSLYWHPNGVLWCRRTYIASIQDGVCETWYSSGLRRELCVYRRGRLFGDYKRWAKDGELVRHSVYDRAHVCTVIYQRVM